MLKPAEPVRWGFFYPQTSARRYEFCCFEDETEARIAQVRYGGRLVALVDGLWMPVLPRKGQNAEAENN